MAFIIFMKCDVNALQKRLWEGSPPLQTLLLNILNYCTMTRVALFPEPDTSMPKQLNPGMMRGSASDHISRSKSA